MWFAIGVIIGIIVTAAVAVWLVKYGLAWAIARGLNW